MEYSYYSGSKITNGARCTRENPELSWQKRHSVRRRLFSQENWTEGRN
jgi:hypothetical protein